MHFVFASSGSFGDLAPLIVMALELRERGHECVFAVNPFHRAAVERWGFAIEPTGDAGHYAKTMLDPRLARRRVCLEALLEGAVGDLRGVYDAIERAARPDSVLVYRALALSARVAEEKLGIPACGVLLCPVELGGIEHPPALGGPMLNLMIRSVPVTVRSACAARVERQLLGESLIPAFQKLRAEVGLPPFEGSVRDEFRRSTAIMAAFPEWLVERESHWPDHLRFSGFMFLPESGELEPAVAAFLDSGPPPVVVSAGSAIRTDDGFTSRMTAAARSLGKRVLVLAFDHRGEAGDDGGVCVCRPQPIHLVLPRAAAVAHRGGIGLTAQCLRFGVPQLMMSQMMDHPDNGERVEKRLGAGRFLYTPRTSDRRISSAMAEVLESPSIRAGAEACVARITPREWHSAAADRLESLRK